MESNRSPGAFLLEAASSGSSLANALLFYGTSEKLKVLASQISLAATFLNEIGNVVNANQRYFKDSFENRFQGVTAKCTKIFDEVRTGLDKAIAGEMKTKEFGNGLIELTNPPKKPWKRLLWGMDIDEDGFDELEDSFDNVSDEIMMLEYTVRLIVLQIRFQERGLTPGEKKILQKLKCKTGWLLERLREADITSVVVFGASEPDKPVNIPVPEPQVIEVPPPHCTCADSTSDSSVTIRNPSEADNDSITKGKKDEPEGIQLEIEKPWSPDPNNDLFELWKTTTSKNPSNKTEPTTLIRILGLPFKFVQIETSEVSWTQVPASQDEIKSFLNRWGSQHINDPSAKLHMMVDAPATASIPIYNIIAQKNELRKFGSRDWTVAACLRWGFHKKPRSWLGKKLGSNVFVSKDPNSYAFVLRGRERERFARPPHFFNGGPPPPQVHRAPRSISSSSISSVRTRRGTSRTACLELSPRETENVLNSFFASISTLYDLVPVEERGAALNAIEIPSDFEDDSDDDFSDGSSSSGSRSLVDD